MFVPAVSPSVNFRRSWLWQGLVGSFLALCLMATVLSARAADRELRIGVLSFRPIAQTLGQWRATAEYLNSQVPGYRFSIAPLYYTELDQAVSRRELDFVLTNPEHYITLRNDFGLVSLATLMPMVDGNPVTQFGGVILTRADRVDISTLDDVRGKNVAIPSEQSLGGYIMQRWTLYKRGITVSDLAGIQTTGMPHDKAVLAVMQGRADVGFVRTGILEHMAQEGSIQLDQFKVLNRQPPGRYAQLLSTDLYPEWPMAAMPQVPSALAQQVAQALFNMAPHEAAAQNGGYYGFAPPGDYASVKAVVDRLELERRAAYVLDLRDLLHKYATEWMVAGLALLTLLAGGAWFLARANQKLSASYSEQKRLDDALQLANTTLEHNVEQRTQQLNRSQMHLKTLFDTMEEGMYGVDTAGYCTFVNAAFLRLLGFDSQDEVLGQHMHTLIHHSHPDGSPYPAEDRRSIEVIQPSGRVHSDVEVFWRKDSTPISVEFWEHPIVEGGQITGYLATFLDISKRIALQGQMHDLAYFDHLTKLANRRLLHDSLHKTLAVSTRHHCHGALFVLDLDNFKNINDTEGHELGDRLLMEVAARLKSCVRRGDVLARLGGDEFVVLCEGLHHDIHHAGVQAGHLAETILHQLAQPYRLDRTGLREQAHPLVCHITASIGVALFDGKDASADELLARADAAMYQAKNKGRNTVRFYDPQLQAELVARAVLEQELRHAYAHDQFALHYQMQVNRDGHPVGAEALLRWSHPERDVSLPEGVIEMLEEMGLIAPVGAWAVRTACAQIREWSNTEHMGTLAISVNVSARQFRQADFEAVVEKALMDTAIPPERLELELTESLLLENVEEAIAKMQRLKEMGVRFALDDFGTGYSSLQYLKQLPIDRIKIDRTFVSDIGAAANGETIVKAIIAMARELGQQVVAEGVESELQRRFLVNHGCAVLQGFLFGKPLAVRDFETFLRSYTLQHGGVSRG